MRAHQRSKKHHSWEWVCQGCGKAFSQKMYMERHQTSTCKKLKDHMLLKDTLLMKDSMHDSIHESLESPFQDSIIIKREPVSSSELDWFHKESKVSYIGSTLKILRFNHLFPPTSIFIPYYSPYDKYGLKLKKCSSVTTQCNTYVLGSTPRFIQICLVSPVRPLAADLIISNQ